MTQKDATFVPDETNLKINTVYSDNNKYNDKKSATQRNDNQPKVKGRLFKNFGKSKTKSESSNLSISVQSKVQHKSVPSSCTSTTSDCSPIKATKFTVETCNLQKQSISNQYDDNNVSINSNRSKRMNKGISMFSEKTTKLINLDSFRLWSNSGTYHAGCYTLPDPMKLPEYEPLSSISFCRTPLKSSDDDNYWVTDGTTNKGHFKRLSRSSISKSEQNLVFNEPSKMIEDALSQSKLSPDIANSTIQVAYRHGVNRVTENDQIIILSKTPNRGRSTYLSEGVHQLDDAETFHAFFQHSTCYDLMPNNSKLVVLDSNLQVGKAFRALIFNGVRAAIIWQVEIQQYVGILTITDFINILNLYVQTSPNISIDIESETIDKWREITGTVNKPLVYVCPESSLFIALTELRNHRVHRLPVIDIRSGNVLHIITHKRLLKYLFIKKFNIPKTDFLKRTIEEENVGTFDSVHTATLETSIMDVLAIFDSKQISAVPIVDPMTKKLVDLYAKFDCIHLASTGNYKDMNLTIAQALKCRSQTSFCVQTCKKTDTLDFVMEKIVIKEVHRLVVINNETEQLVEGIVSLADLLHHFILKLNNRDSGGNIMNGIVSCSDFESGSQSQDTLRSEKSQSAIDTDTCEVNNILDER